MKKQFMILLLFAVSVSLIGCRKENTPPVFTGPTELTFLVGTEEPDWQSLVTVNDSEDGRIFLYDKDIDDDQVDMLKLGSFEIIYVVVDSDGIEVTHILEVTIEPRESSIVLIGETETNHEVNAPYNDQGVIAMDMYGLETTYTVEGDVIIDELGSYTLTYTSIDGQSLYHQ